MERKLIEITKVNEYGYIGYKFEDSKAFASGKVKTDKNGRQYFVSKGQKYYISEESAESSPKKWREEKWAADAIKSNELIIYLENWVSDFGKEPTLDDAIKEARYILTTFNEGGHGNCEDLVGENGMEAKTRARKEVRALNNFVKKYD